MVAKKKKQQGHYCRICSEYKANEQFSGKGHSRHICKECRSLPDDVKEHINFELHVMKTMGGHGAL